MQVSGVSFMSLLGLLFIGLKLGGIIFWSWWWVLAPFWLPLTLVVAVGCIMGLALTVGMSFGTSTRKGHRGF